MLFILYNYEDICTYLSHLKAFFFFIYKNIMSNNLGKWSVFNVWGVIICNHMKSYIPK